MKREKYIYHNDLKKYKNFKVPVNKLILFFADIFLGLIYCFQKTNKKIKVEKKKIKSFDNKSVNFLIYTPKNVNLNDSCLLFVHGGGFVFKGSIHHYVLAKNMANKLKCKVVYVDYRLAPKYKFPTAMNDVFEVYKWIVDNKDILNINENKLIVMGDSAGGNLSVLTTILAKENNYPVPKINMLLYPVLTDRLKTNSYIKYDDTPLCNSCDCDKYWKYYYENSNEDRSIYRSLYDTYIFDNYPSTYIEVAEYDCLHDDGVLYYENLLDKNVCVKLNEVLGAMHGYDIAYNSSLVSKLNAKRVEFIEENINKN